MFTKSVIEAFFLHTHVLYPCLFVCAGVPTYFSLHVCVYFSYAHDPLCCGTWVRSFYRTTGSVLVTSSCALLCIKAWFKVRR